MRGVHPWLAMAILPLAAGCAHQASNAVVPEGPGFLLGLWHGFIFPVAWLVSLFSDEAALYAVPNNGGWYDFGYFLGIVVFGVGAGKSGVVYRDGVLTARVGSGHERVVEGSHRVVREDDPA